MVKLPHRIRPYEAVCAVCGVVEERRRKMKYREFTVTPGMVGFKVSIGCRDAYFGDKDSVGKAIVDYLNDPQRVEEVYIEEDIKMFDRAEI
jgi:hypothetical protein